MHGTTTEITTDPHLTLRGDCIIGVAATKAVSQLSPSVKKALANETARVRFTIVAPGGEFSLWAKGSKGLSFESRTDLVIRKSEYICGRTIAVQAEYSARDIPRGLVRSLKSPEAAGLLRIEVYV